MSNIKIFVSYSHKDTEYIGSDGLLGFLKGLESGGDVELWVDEKISGGDQWDDVLRREIESCDIGLIFVSQAFLDSHYCTNVELSTFLDRCRTDGMKIFPVILSPCEWELHPWISKYQGLPTSNETIEEHYVEPGKRKRLYLKIRKELRALIEQVRADKLAIANKKTDIPEVNSERRNVTLLQMKLSVDLQKYHMDEEDQMEFLHEAAPLVKERYISEVELLEGFVIYMSGTGQISVCFGYPNASEMDSVKAVRAALGILESVEAINDQLEREWDARLTIKAGIHSGLMIGRTGADTQQELEHGPTSSITGMVMRASPGGSILISESTYKLVKGFFKMKASEDVLNEDTRELIKCWEVLEDRGALSRFEAKLNNGLTPIIGRDEEIKLIMERWNGQGEFVLINAEAGIGKSRLLQEIKHKISLKESQLFSCQFSPFHKNTPLFGLIKAFEDWIGISESDTDDQKLEVIETLVTSMSWGNDDIIAILASVFSVENTKYRLPEIPPKQLKAKTFEICFSLLAESSFSTPLLFVLEDLHWMDPSTMEWLEMVFNEIPDTNILVIATTRPEFNPPVRWINEQYYYPLKLDNLSRSQISEMVSKLTDGRSLPLELFDEICKKTEGYPLFVEDLTTMVLESDMLEEKEGQFLLTKPIESLSIPGTLQESLMARLNNLEGGRLLAQIGSVIGREFSFNLISSIAPMEEDKLKEVLNRLVNAGIMYKRGLMSRVVYIFKHALIQDALYESLLKRKRKVYHKKIADIIESKFPDIATKQPELVAIHYSNANNYKNSVKYGSIACKRSAHNSAHLETSNLAVSTLNDLRKLPPSKERDTIEKEIHLLHGPALLAVKGWSSPEIGNAYTKAKELSKTENNLEELVQITRGLWAYYMVSSQLEDSVKIACELEELAKENNSDGIQIETHATFCDSYFWQGKLRLSQEHAEKGLALYDLDTHHVKHTVSYGEDPSGIMLCYSGVSSWLLGEEEKAQGIVEYVKENLENYSHLFSRGFLMNGVAWHYMHQHMAEETLFWGEKLKKLATEEEYPPWLALAKTHVGWATAVLGNLEEGVEELLEGIAEWNASGLVVTTGLGYAMVCNAYSQAGDHENLLKYAQIGIDHVESVEEKHCHSEFLRYKAEVLSLDKNTHKEAKELFEKSIEVATKQGAIAYVNRTKESYQRLLEK
ncbi:MAG: AAA family ATPase [Flavobacteriaceae bacterium]